MMRVLHVTEAMGAGVVTVMVSISGRQREAGADPHVWYVRRADTPAAADLADRFGDVPLEELDAGPDAGGLARLRVLHRRLRAAYRSGEFDVVHLHSSLAGVVGRLALLGRPTRTRVVYSPHGFAFLRLSTGRAMRSATALAERVLARVGAGLILTSPSELALAVGRLRAPRTRLLQTGIPSSEIDALEYEPGVREVPVVAMIGRVTFQKAPWRFAAVARALEGRAEFLWIGDGDPADRERWFGDAPLQVAGWLSPQELAQRLRGVDVLLFPTLWEGMSLALMEAQARGIPAVVSDAVGNVDSVLDGETGWICSDDDALIARTGQLVDDRDLRVRMSHASRVWARRALVDDAVGVDSLRLYAELGASERAAEGSAGG